MNHMLGLRNKYLNYFFVHQTNAKLIAHDFRIHTKWIENVFFLLLIVISIKLYSHSTTLLNIFEDYSMSFFFSFFFWMRLTVLNSKCLPFRYN